jgi:5'-nucleotidase
LSDEPSFYVLTNDDGWDSPGLDALRQAALALGRCRVIAPVGCHSSCGHGVTTHAPIGVEVKGDGLIAVAGTPADCVRLALYQLAPKPRWIFSGINAGANLGADIHHSGTVAAVREGVLRGVRGIALSHYIARGRAIDWAAAARWARKVLCQLVALPWEPGTFWNVNFPHPEVGGQDPAVVFCPLDPSPLPLAYRMDDGRFVYAGDYQKRARQAGADIDVCFGGQIAVTLVRVIASCRPVQSNPAQTVD